MRADYPSPILSLGDVQRVLAGASRRKRAKPPAGPTAGSKRFVLGSGRRIPARHTAQEVEAVRSLFIVDLAVDRVRPDADPLPSVLAGTVAVGTGMALVQVRWLGGEAECTAHALETWHAGRAPNRALERVQSALLSA